MDNGGVASQVVKEIKDLGGETGKQLGEVGKEIIKGTVSELLGDDQRRRVEQGGPQQAPVTSEVDEFKQRKQAEKEQGLKRVRSQLENYRQWQKQLKEELGVQEERKEEQVKVAKKEEKKNFWRNLIGRNRSKYAGTGEVVKAHN